MKTAYIGIIQTALDRGFETVLYTEQTGPTASIKNLELILRIILTSEESEVRFFQGDKRLVGKLLITPTGFSYKDNQHKLNSPTAGDLYKTMFSNEVSA